MRNFMYLLGDSQTREALVVDPAWDVRSLLDVAEADGYTVRGALVTHYHPDHVGGDLWGVHVEGLGRLLEQIAVPIYVNKHEGDGLRKVTGLEESDLKRVDDADRVKIGDIEIQFLHTPGHTPGSQCFLLDGRLVAGDTLFLEGCGRTDFPGGDVDDMFRSLQALAQLSGDPTVFPGHWYSAEPSASLSEVRQTNYVYRASNLDQWRMLMGG